MRRLHIILALVGALFCVAGASAHELRPGLLELVETAPKAYDVTWKAPVIAGRPIPVEPQFPPDCAVRHQDAHTAEGAALIVRSAIDCKAPLQGRTIALAGLDATLTDALVRFDPLDGLVQALRATPQNPEVSPEVEPDRGGVARTYFKLGVEHILTGADHLMFVLALVLLIGGLRRLVETITAFTLAHSLTLVATTLGWMSMPRAPTEALIALSIVFLANEVAHKNSGAERLSERWPHLVAFVFGLLHGFGFAGALAEIGLPHREIPTALFTFNVGVEAGQLLFVAVILSVLAAIGARGRPLAEKAASYGIGAMASYWLIARVAG